MHYGFSGRTLTEITTIYIRDNDFDVVGLSTFTNTIIFLLTAKLCEQILPKCRWFLVGYMRLLPQRTLEECLRQLSCYGEGV